MSFISDNQDPGPPLTGKGYDADPVAVDIHGKIYRAETERMAIIDDWLLNRAYTRGQQWHKWDRRGKKLQGKKFASWRKRPVVNESYTIERVVVAKMLARQPIPNTIPATSDEQDVETARVLNDLLSYQWRSQDMVLEAINFVIDLWETGNAWWKVQWDANAGEEIEDDLGGMPGMAGMAGMPGMASMMGQEVSGAEESLRLLGISGKGRKTGDLDVESVSPFQIYTQPGCKKFSRCRWVAQVHLMHVDAIWERWKKRVSPTGTIGKWRQQESDYRETQRVKPDMARVIEFWEKPSHHHPKGRYLVVASGVVLEQEAELPHGRFPFVHCVFWPDPERLEGTTPCSSGRAMQRELNMNVGMMLEGREMHTFGKMFVQKGSGIKGMSTKPGEVIEYNNVGHPPQWVNGQPVSEQTFRMTDMFRGLLRSTTGVNDSSMGSAESASSGRELAFAAEEDNTKLGPTMMIFKRSLKLLAKLMLETWKENASGELTYAVLGENNEYEIKAFDASKIRYKDVEFNISSGLSLNKEARRQELLMMFQIGVIDAQQFAKLMEMGDIDAVIGHHNLDKQRARKENQLLLEGPVNAQPWEDHTVHMECHLTFMKQARFYTLPPAVQQLYMLHLQEHANYVNGSGGGMQTAAPPQAGGPQGQGSPQPDMTAPFQVSSPNMVALNPSEQDAVAAIQGTS